MSFNSDRQVDDENSVVSQNVCSEETLTCSGTVHSACGMPTRPNISHNRNIIDNREHTDEHDCLSVSAFLRPLQRDELSESVDSSFLRPGHRRRCLEVLHSINPDRGRKENCDEYYQETQVETAEVGFTWVINNVSCLRDHAAMAALPNMQNFLESREFGSDKTGWWYLMLFLRGETSKEYDGLIVKVVSNNRQSLTAQVMISLLDESGETIPGTLRCFDGFRWFQTSLYYNSVCLAADDEVADYLEKCSEDTMRLRCRLQVIRQIMDLPSHTMSPLQSSISSTSIGNQLRDYAINLDGKDLSVHCNVFDEIGKGVLIKDGKDISKRDNKSKNAIKASRYVLSARSKVFRSMLCGRFLESGTKDVFLRDVDGNTCQQLMDFLHTDTCEALKEYPPQHKHLLQILKAADKYDCTSLSQKIVDILSANLTKDTVLEILLNARELKLINLEDSCHAFLKSQKSLEKHLCSFLSK